jgi:hypothetical protein
MGTVMLSPDVLNSNWPTKVPAAAPPPGKLLAVTPMLMLAGAAPLEEDAVSQPPPSEVLVVSDQFRVPDPPFRICNGCEVAEALVLKEKLSLPGRSSKNAVPDDATVSVTGIVILMAALEKLVITTCPVYVPAARVPAATLTVVASGVKQHPLPAGETESQLPPLVVDTAVLKRTVD